MRTHPGPLLPRLPGLDPSSICLHLHSVDDCRNKRRETPLPPYLLGSAFLAAV